MRQRKSRQVCTMVVAGLSVVISVLFVGMGGISIVATPCVAQTQSQAKDDRAPVAKVNAASDEDDARTKVFSSSINALLKLFVLALLLESALALIFDWQVYRTYFNARGMNGLVAFAAALLLIKGWETDPFSSLVMEYSGSTFDDKLFTQVIAALIIAGGSSGVNRILTGLGYRLRAAEVEEREKPNVSTAWVAVHVSRRNAIGPIFVKLKQSHVAGVAVIPATTTGGYMIAGVIERRPFNRRLRNLFLRDPNRFPQSGGYVVTPGIPYDIEIEARDANGQRLSNPRTGPFVFADRAIVNFDLTV